MVHRTEILFFVLKAFSSVLSCYLYGIVTRKEEEAGPSQLGQGADKSHRLFLGTRGRSRLGQRRPDILATQLDAQSPFQLGKDLLGRDGLSALVVVDDGRLLVDFCSEVLLGHCWLFGETSLLHGLSDIRVDLGNLANIVLTVDLSRTKDVREVSRPDGWGGLGRT